MGKHDENILNIFNTLNDAVILIDFSGKIRYVNKKAEELTGYSEDELYSLNIFKIVAPEYASNIKKKMERRQKGIKSKFFYEIELMNKNGNKVAVEISSSLVESEEKEKRILIIVRDITVNKEKEAEIQKIANFNYTYNKLLRLSYEECNLKSFLNKALEVLISLDWLSIEAKGAIFLKEGEYLKLVSYINIPKELLESCSSVPVGKCLCGMAALKKKIISSSRPDKAHEIKYNGMKKHGHYIIPMMDEKEVVGVLNLYIPYKFSPTREEKEFLDGAAKIIALIIKRFKIRNELDNSKERYRMILENINEIVYLVEINGGHFLGEMKFVSERVETVTGYKKEEVQKDPELWFNIVHPDDKEKLIESTQRILTSGNSDIRIYRICHRKTREYRWIEDIVVPNLDDNNKVVGFFGVARDITEHMRRDNEMKILQSINNAINRGTPLEHVFQMATDGVRKNFNYSACDIYLIDLDKSELMSTALSIDAKLKNEIERISKTKIKDIRIPLSRNSSFSRTIENKAVYTTDNIVSVFHDYSDIKIPDFLTEKLIRILGFKYFIRVPLIAGDKVIGVMGAARDRNITDEDARVLKRFASQLALAVKKAKLEETLRESEEKFRSVVETATDAIITTDISGKVIFWNRAAEEIFEYKEDEIIYKPIDLIISDKSVDAHYKDIKGSTLKNLLQAGKRTFEGTGKRKDRSEFPVEISTSTWEINNEIYLTAIIRDINKRKRIENELVETLKKISVINVLDRKISSSLDISEVYSTFAKEMRKLIDFNRIYVFSIKNNDIILETTENFGISESRIDTGNKIDLENIIAKSSISSLKTIIRNIDKPETSEDRIFYNDGIRSYICVPLVTDKPVGLLYISSIEENAFSYEIIPLIEDLSIQLAIAIEKSNMYSELKKAYDELKEVDELKNNIIANVRHEILTPVTVIKGSLEILEEEAESEECRNLISTSKRYLRKLADIVDDLVVISKFYRKDFKLNIKRVNLVSVLEKALEEKKAYAEEKNVDISKNIEDKIIEIEADERYLKKAIINLLDNAIKFNKAGGNVYVHISKSGDKAVIKICDTGIGIPKGKIDEIFHPLTQLDSTIKRKYGGTGSGLAVAKKIIELHSGELKVHSEPDKGTTFELIIPLK